MPCQYDIAIVGGGFVGRTLACALAAASYRIALVESQPVPATNGTAVKRDERSIALNLASKRMLDTLGVWELLDVYSTPIKKIHVSDQGRFGVMRLDCRHHGTESFGYLVPAEKLTLALQKHLRLHEHIQHIQPYRVSGIENCTDKITLHGAGEPIQAKLLIAADGAHSFIRNKLSIPVDEKQYRQTAIVGNIRLDDHHRYTAYERFTRQGPLALLPREGNYCGFIWMNPDDVAQEHLALSDEDFLLRLQRAFGYRLGYFSRPGKRFAYPLSLLVSQRRVQRRAVLVGNAAQTLHPIAAQGLNLALRDIAELSETLCTSQGALDDINGKLSAYESRRHSDMEHTVRLTNRLNFLFTTDNPVLSRTRGIGLALSGAIPVLENRIMQRSSGALSSTANLLQGRALQPS